MILIAIASAPATVHSQRGDVFGAGQGVLQPPPPPGDVFSGNSKSDCIRGRDEYLRYLARWNAENMKAIDAQDLESKKTRDFAAARYPGNVEATKQFDAEYRHALEANAHDRREQTRWYDCLVARYKEVCSITDWNTWRRQVADCDRRTPGDIRAETSQRPERSPERPDPAVEKYLRDHHVTCVDLYRSALLVDRLLKDKPIGDYNCFYYVKTFIQRGTPLPVPPPPFNMYTGPTETLWGEDLMNAGYRGPNTGSFGLLWTAKVGDIVMVRGSQGGLQATYPYVHAAVVTEVDTRGTILRLRQKLDVFHCVADLTWPQFQELYAGKTAAGAGGYELWSNPRRAGSLQ
jgi:hypothetical protein